jgi:hypothetical protein
MKTELGKPNPVVVDLLEIDLPDGTHRYAEVGVIVAGEGMYEARILAWGSFSKGVAPRQNSLELQRTTVKISDQDFVFAKLVEGSTGNAIRGSAVRCYLAGRGMGKADWYPTLVGRLATFTQDEPLTWTLTLTPNDLPLQRETLGRATITFGDWPVADTKIYGTVAPIYYGKWNAVGTSSYGAVPTYYVDKTNFVYLVCAGWAKAVDNVYKNKDPNPITTGFSVTHPVVNGRVYTCLDFTTDQTTAEFTCDIQGIETAGDGTGTLITDPPTVLAHLLQNFAFNDYKSGAYAGATSAMFNSTWATTYFSSRGFGASIQIDSRRKGIDVLNDWLRTFNAKAFWRNDGTISLLVEDPGAFAYVTDSAAIATEDDLHGGWKVDYPTGDLLDRIDVDFLYDPVQGRFTQYLTVADLQTNELAAENMQMQYSPAYVT